MNELISKNQRIKLDVLVYWRISYRKSNPNFVFIDAWRKFASTAAVLR